MTTATRHSERSEESRHLPEGWRRVPLGSVCDLNPRRRTDFRRDEMAATTFVPMAAVDDQTGTIVSPEVRPFVEVRRGYTYFEEGDVLFAKITPCMQNGKHAIAYGLIDGIGLGTTEFHVIRPGSEITPEWVHLFIRQPVVLKNAESHFTGAVGQQRVPEDFLRLLEIPLPPLPEQRRIAAILQDQLAAVERARAAAEAQIEAAKALPAAYLRAVFNSSKARQWPMFHLGEVGKIVSGITLGRKLNGVSTRKVPYLRVANVKDGRLDLSDIYEIDATDADITKCQLKYGDLLLTEGGDADKLGRGTFWEEQLPLCLHQNHIFRVRFDLGRFSPQFVSAQIGSPYGKAYFLAHAKQTTGIATINQRVLSRFPLLSPTLAEQRRIAATLNEQMTMAEQAREALQAQLDVINQLPAVLLRRAFNGEL